jgi:hypothetical protein
MEYISLRKALGMGCLVLLVCVPARAQNSQQSGDPVADAARKAKEEKKIAPKPKKVYTEDDISTKKDDISVVGPAAPQTDPTTAAANTNSTKPKADASSKTKDKESQDPEKIWRAKFAALREKLSTAEQDLDVLQREENKGDVQYYSDPTKALNEQYSRDELYKRATKIDAKKKEVADLKQQWSDLEDQLRKAGGDPGWAR